MECSKRSKIIITTFLFVIGAILFIFGFAGPAIIDNKLNSGIRSLIVIDSKDAKGFKTWSDNTGKDVPKEYQNFYVWNLTNPDEVLQGEIPKMKEIGPYVYIKNQKRFKIFWKEDGNHIGFKEWDYWTFVPSKSVGDPSKDVITTVNLPFQGVHANLGNEWWQELIFDIFASAAKSDLFVTLTPSELIWGYEDPLLELVHNLTGTGPTSFQLQVNATSEEDADQQFLFDVYNTGKKDIKQVAQFVQWQNQTKLSFWGSEEANKLGGTDATQFHPNVKDSDKLQFFTDDLKRTGYLCLDKHITLKGIKLKSFTICSYQLQNATERPENAAYYAYGPSGVLNITSASQGTPIFVSYPHFLDADPYYREQVEGMHPDSKKHRTHINVEPISGTTLQAFKRLQFNCQVRDIMLLYPNMTERYIPIAWVELTSEITDDLAKKFKDAVYGAQKASKGIKYFGIIGGSIGLFVAIVLVAILVFRKSSSDGYHQIQNEQIHK